MEKVTLKYRNQQWELPAGMTARDAIKKTGLLPESVLIVVDGELQTDDVILKPGQQVKLVAVVSGGAA
ncbi:MAG: MoaD/ThiS family protein [Anaerolineales bacterium]|nr:MoaD/ThiS family protein [Anaerolineales bacterium]